MKPAHEDESECGRAYDFGLAPELSAIDSHLRSLRPERSASGLAEMLFAAGRASGLAEDLPQHAAAKYVLRKHSRRSTFFRGIASGVAASLFATGILFMSLRSTQTQTIVNGPEHDSTNEAFEDPGDSPDEPSVQLVASSPLRISAPSNETVDLSAVSLAARQQWYSASASIETIMVSAPHLPSSSSTSRTRAGLIEAMLRDEVF